MDIFQSRKEESLRRLISKRVQKDKPNYDKARGDIDSFYVYLKDECQRIGLYRDDLMGLLNDDKFLASANVQIGSDNVSNGNDTQKDSDVKPSGATAKPNESSEASERNSSSVVASGEMPSLDEIMDTISDFIDENLFSPWYHYENDGAIDANISNQINKISSLSGTVATVGSIKYIQRKLKTPKVTCFAIGVYASGYVVSHFLNGHIMSFLLYSWLMHDLFRVSSNLYHESYILLGIRNTVKQSLQPSNLLNSFMNSLSSIVSGKQDLSRFAGVDHGYMKKIDVKLLLHATATEKIARIAADIIKKAKDD